MVGVRHVADVDQQIGRSDLLERRAECRDQLGRKIGDEANRVGQDRLVEPRHLHVAHRRIERGEEHILRQHSVAGHGVEKGRFAGVRVADERDDRPRRALAPSAMQRTRAFHLVELAPNLAPCDRGSAGGPPRSGFHRGRRGSRSRRAAVRGGSKCGPGDRPGSRDGPVRPAAGLRRLPPSRRRFPG